MNPAHKNHAAVRFGLALKQLRMSRGYTARAFADQLDLAPSKYTEIELGIVKWLTKRHEELTAYALNLTTEQLKDLGQKLRAAKEASALTFSDIFSRETLRPLRLRLDGKKATEEDQESLLDEVFAELV